MYILILHDHDYKMMKYNSCLLNKGKSKEIRQIIFVLVEHIVHVTRGVI